MLYLNTSERGYVSHVQYLIFDNGSGETEEEDLSTVKNKQQSEMTGRFCTVGEQMLVQVIIPLLCSNMGCTRGRKSM